MSERVVPETEQASTGELIGRLSEQTSTLVRDELRLAQAELTAKAKHVGVGVGMFGAGGVLALYGIAGALTTIILALALVLPAWAAALIVTVVLFIAAAIVSLLGKKQVNQATPMTPEHTTASVKRDVAEVKEHAHHGTH